MRRRPDSAASVKTADLIIARHPAPLWFLLLTILLLVMALLLGGGRGSLADVAVQMLAIGLLFTQAALPDASRTPRSLWLIALLVVSLPLLHLLPIAPHAGWMGVLREQSLRDMQFVAAPIGSRLSLHPLAAERALWSLLPALAMLFAVSRLVGSQRRWLVIALLLLAIVNVLFGMAQLADGEQSTLRLHSPTNISDAVGFFANRNHLASLLAVSLPFAIGAAALAWRRRRPGSASDLFGVAGFVAVAALLLIGIALARSRAGFLLCMLAMLLSVPVLWRLGERRRGRALLFMLAVALLLSIQLALFGLLQRLQTDPLDDGRWEYARVVALAAKATAPLGSGIGTFAEVYPQFEAETGAGPGYAVVNHAHNDVLEWWLEAGVAFALIAVVFIIVLIRIGVRLWRAPASSPIEALLIARLAWVSALLLLLHSCFDYPLRTTAMMTVLAMLLGLCVPTMSASTPAIGQKS